MILPEEPAVGPESDAMVAINPAFSFEPSDRRRCTAGNDEPSQAHTAPEHTRHIPVAAADGESAWESLLEELLELVAADLNVHLLDD
jgi:hypothetical protein